MASRLILDLKPYILRFFDDELILSSYKLLVVDVEPEFADEDEVSPDSSC